MTSKSIIVIDAVLNEWSAAFEGTPEAQMDALNWLADLRKKPTLKRTAALIKIHAMPPEQWADEMLKFWMADEIAAGAHE